MGYNKDDYIKVRNEFSNKYLRARREAEIKTAEIHALIPEINKIDAVLSGTGMDIMKIVSSPVTDKEAEVAKLRSRNDALIAEREEYLRANGYPPDYTDVHYDCPKCGDTGYVDTHMCECMKRAIAQEGYRSSGLGRLIDEQDFENFELKYYPEDERGRIEKYVKMLRGFAESFSNESYGNFILTGTTGLGKTHLSTAVAKTVIERGFDVLYVSAVNMLGDFEAERFGSEMGQHGADLTRYYGADLLIIDDLGTEVINKFTQTYLYNVINSRLNAKRSTMINTNFTPAELNSVYTSRVSSRLMGEYMPMLFRGVDIRKQKNGIR